MGELIQGNFGRNKETKNVTKSEPDNVISASFSKPTTSSENISIENYDVQEFLKRFLNNDEAFLFADKIEDFIVRLNLGAISREVLTTAQKTWEGRDRSELIEIAKNSTEAQWKKSPGLFLELARALRNSGLVK